MRPPCAPLAGIVWRRPGGGGVARDGGGGFGTETPVCHVSNKDLFIQDVPYTTMTMPMHIPI